MLELFQSAGGQLLLEYLLAASDLYKDKFFEGTTSTPEDLKFLQGQLNVLEDIIGLPAFVRSFRDMNSK